MNGIRATLIRSMRSPVTDESTNRQAPTGGVINEMLRVRMIMMPAWTGSMPIAEVSGTSTGARMISAALMSMNMPTATSSIRIIPRIIVGSSDRVRNSAATDCGICRKVIHQLRIDAEAMIRKTTPVMIAVRTSICTMSSKVMAR